MKNITLKKSRLSFITALMTSSLFIAVAHAEMDHADHSKYEMKEKKEMKSDHKHHEMKEMTPEMKAHHNKIYEAYLNISKGLSADNFAMAKEGVDALKKEMDNAPEKCTHKENDHHPKILGLAKAMNAAKDIDALRVSFKNFSEEFIKNFGKHTEGLDKDFKVFYCPMKKGGHWVQDEAGTKNPYYGAEMLTCGGEVKE